MIYNNSMILASASPRRQNLMSKITRDFSVCVANVQEVFCGEPENVCLTNAKIKAMAVAKDNPSEIVIGADTVVVLNGEILGKPADKEQNRFYLKMLSGAVHSVYTGYAVCKGDKLVCQVVETKVEFNVLSQEVIDKYIGGGFGLDKAGGYGIQDGFELVKTIYGSYENVVGFCTETVKNLLKKLSGEIIK